jgi:hypothetical protein
MIRDCPDCAGTGTVWVPAWAEIRETGNWSGDSTDCSFALVKHPATRERCNLCKGIGRVECLPLMEVQSQTTKQAAAEAAGGTHDET